MINVNGRVFMDALECPFKSVLAAQEELAKETKIIKSNNHHNVHHSPTVVNY